MLTHPIFRWNLLLALLVTLTGSGSAAAASAPDKEEETQPTQLDVRRHKLEAAEAAHLPEAEALRKDLEEAEARLKATRLRAERRRQAAAAAADPDDQEAAAKARLEAAERAAVEALQGSRRPTTRPARREDREAEARARGEGRGDGRGQPQGEAAARARLARIIPEVKLDGIAFADAIDHLRDVTGLNIYVKWKALEQAGVDRNAPVTLRLKEVSAERAMQFVLDDASVNGAVGMTLDDGTVIVTAAADMA